MPRITPLSCKEIKRRLEALDFVLDHEDGNIKFYVRIIDDEAHVVQLHDHPGDKDASTICAILRTGDISRDEWLEA